MRDVSSSALLSLYEMCYNTCFSGPAIKTGTFIGLLAAEASNQKDFLTSSRLHTRGCSPGGEALIKGI